VEFRPQRRSQRQRTSKSEESSNVSVYNRFDAFEDDEEEVVPATVYSFGPESPSLEARTYLGPKLKPVKRGKLVMSKKMSDGGRALREAPFFHRKPHDFGPENPSLEERAFLGAEIPPPAPAQRAGFGGRALREAPRSRPRFTNSAAVNGVSTDNGVDRDTVEINAVAAGTKWSSKASIRFNVADVQRPLASASKVVAKGNRIVLEEGGSFIQSVSTGEKIALRVERGVYVFDAKYEDGSTGTMALDSGAGVCVWPQDWKTDAPMEPKAPGLRMVAANGTEIANLGQKVIRFNAIQPFAGQR